MSETLTPHRNTRRWLWLDYTFGAIIVGGAVYLVWVWRGADAPPVTPRAQIEDGASVGTFDPDAVSAFLSWHGLAAPRLPLSELETGLARRVEEVLGGLSQDGTAASFGRAGQVFEFLKRPAVARDCYRRAGSMDSTDHRWPHYLGRLALAAGDLNEAERQFLQAIELRPFFAASQAQLARVYVEADRLSAAVAALQRAIEKAPENPFGHVLLARIAMRQEQYEEAIRHSLDALQRDPDHGQAHAILGQAYAHTSHHEQAVAHARRAAGARPEMADVGDPLVTELLEASGSTTWLSILATTQHAQGDWPALIRTLESLVQREPEKISHQLDLAEAYVAERRLDDASTVAETAVAASGGTPRCYQVLSVIALYQKDYRLALTRADEAIELDGAYAAAHKSRAAALGGLGRLNEAIQSAETAAKLSPQDAHIRALVDFLRTQQATRQSGGS